MKNLCCGRFRLSLSFDDLPLVMGIVNLTSDSFSGDGTGSDLAAALRRAEAQKAAGADLIDLGAESTRPGALPVPAETQWARLFPVLRVVRDWGLPVSVDTCAPEVMRRAIDEGADLINDIGALGAPGAMEAVASSEVAICLMHRQGESRTMQADPRYGDVVTEVRDFLAQRVSACAQAGIARERLLIDPGFGFGKTLAHNYALLRDLGVLGQIGVPVLAGLSRKSMLGAVTGRENGEARLPASIVAAVLAVDRGARVVRVHDVAATRDALAVWAAMQGRGGEDA